MGIHHVPKPMGIPIPTAALVSGSFFIFTVSRLRVHFSMTHKTVTAAAKLRRYIFNRYELSYSQW